MQWSWPLLSAPLPKVLWEDQDGQPLLGLPVSSSLTSAAEKMSFFTLGQSLHSPEDQWTPVITAQLSAKTGFLTNWTFL